MSNVMRLAPSDREVVIRHLSDGLANRADIVFAYVYGSFLRDEGFHDIDVAVWTEDVASRRTDLELAADLSRRIGYQVDVRAVNNAPTTFLFHVVRGRLLAVRDERGDDDHFDRRLIGCGQVLTVCGTHCDDMAARCNHADGLKDGCLSWRFE